MKTIVFIVTGTEKWMGGLYYYKNLFWQLLQNESFCTKYRIVAIVNPMAMKELQKEFQDRIDMYIYNEENREERWAMWKDWMNKADYMFKYTSFAFLDLEGTNSEKGIEWIPDFQHNHLPEYFSEKDLEERTSLFTRIAQCGHRVMFSSEDCKKDFYQYYPVDAKTKVGVVPFVSAIADVVSNISSQSIEFYKQKYKIDKPYVMISNQFYQHKNHKVVFEAIDYGVRQGKLDGISFVFTGYMSDPRKDDYSAQIAQYLEMDNVKNNSYVLGLIDRADQLNLMAGAICVIQPSLFEGWGTTTEDAKVLDKTVLLSDISVHREQKNEKGYLFDPYDEKELVELLAKIVDMNVEDNIENGIENMKSKALMYSNSFISLLED